MQNALQDEQVYNTEIRNSSKLEDFLSFFRRIPSVSIISVLSKYYGMWYIKDKRFLLFAETQSVYRVNEITVTFFWE